MKRFCEYLRKHAIKINNFKKKKMKLLTNEQQYLYTIFVKKSLKINILKIKNIVMLEIIVIIQVNIEVLHIADLFQNIVYLKQFLYFSQWM